MNSDTFHQLIIDDAFGVKGRQEMDSIAIIDDVRYHIDLLHQHSHEAREKHSMINRLLTSLNLEAWKGFPFNVDFTLTFDFSKIQITDE